MSDLCIVTMDRCCLQCGMARATKQQAIGRIGDVDVNVGQLMAEVEKLAICVAMVGLSGFGSPARLPANWKNAASVWPAFL